MQSQLRRGIVWTGLVLAFAAPPARADGILLVGAYPATGSGPTLGVAFGRWSRPVGFEIELASTVGATPRDRSNASISGNLLVNTPLKFGRARVYGVAGLGVYGESRGPRGSSGEVQAYVLGAGLTVPLQDRLRLRLDYRVYSGPTDGTVGFPRTVHAPRLSLGVGIGF